jgi:hypothetical protein
MDDMRTESQERDEAFFAMLMDAGLNRWVARRLTGLSWPRNALELLRDLVAAGVTIDEQTVIDFLAGRLNVSRGRIGHATMRASRLSRRDAVELVRFAATRGPRPGTARYQAFLAMRGRA